MKGKEALVVFGLSFLISGFISLVFFGLSIAVFLIFFLITSFILLFLKRYFKFSKPFGQYQLSPFAIVTDFGRWQIHDAYALEAPVHLMSKKIKIKKFDEYSGEVLDEEVLELNFKSVWKELLGKHIAEMMYEYTGPKNIRDEITKFLVEIFSIDAEPKLYQVVSGANNLIIYWFGNSQPAEYGIYRTKMFFKKWNIMPWFSLRGLPVVEAFGIVLDGTVTINEEFDFQCLFCLVPDTKIITDNGIKRIEEVNIGDNVFTHSGNFKNVTKVMKRMVNEDLIEIHLWKDNEILKLTSEHPVYAIKIKPCEFARVPFCFDWSKDWGRNWNPCKKCTNRYFEQYKPEWVQAKNLTENDLIVTPILKETNIEKIKISDYVTIPHIIKDGNIVSSTNYANSVGYTYQSKHIPNEISLDNDFMRLFGYYIAEGHCTKDCIAFTFNINEIEYINDVVNIIKNVFKTDVSIHSNNQTHSTQIIVSSRILGNFFKNVFASGAKNRHLPQWLLVADKEKQKELIKGWWRGDGSDDFNEYNIATSSYELAEQGRIILRRLGISSTFSRKRSKGFRWGKQYDTVFYVLRIVGYNFLEKFSNIIGEKHHETGTRNHRSKEILTDDYIAIPIKCIKKVPYNGFVHNLKVAEDNSYCTHSGIVHNCLPVFDESYRKYKSLNLQKYAVIADSLATLAQKFNKALPTFDYIELLEAEKDRALQERDVYRNGVMKAYSDVSDVSVLFTETLSQISSVIGSVSTMPFLPDETKNAIRQLTPVLEQAKSKVDSFKQKASGFLKEEWKPKEEQQSSGEEKTEKITS